MKLFVLTIVPAVACASSIGLAIVVLFDVLTFVSDLGYTPAYLDSRYD